MSIRVAGIDPSLTATGYAHIDGSLSTIVYPTNVTNDWRIHSLYWWIVNLLDTELPTHVLIEGMMEHKGHAAGTQGMVQGVIRLALMQQKTPYTTVPPAALKKFATGRGNATKSDMRMELYKRTDIDNADDNQVDAAWLRYLGLYLLNQPAFPLPQTQTVALEKLKTAIPAPL